MNACQLLQPLLLSAVVLCSPLAQAQGPSCKPDGTQSELNACAQDALAAAEAELNAVLQQIHERHAENQDFLERLDKAQAHWVAFRDAELEARFPVSAGQNPLTLYGSAGAMCISYAKAHLTHERTVQLKKWLDGAEEGNVCTGSYPVAEQ